MFRDVASLSSLPRCPFHGEGDTSSNIAFASSVGNIGGAAAPLLARHSGWSRSHSRLSAPPPPPPLPRTPPRALLAPPLFSRPPPLRLVPELGRGLGREWLGLGTEPSNETSAPSSSGPPRSEAERPSSCCDAGWLCSLCSAGRRWLAARHCSARKRRASRHAAAPVSSSRARSAPVASTPYARRLSATTFMKPLRNTSSTTASNVGGGGRQWWWVVDGGW